MWGQSVNHKLERAARNACMGWKLAIRGRLGRRALGGVMIVCCLGRRIQKIEDRGVGFFGGHRPDGRRAMPCVWRGWGVSDRRPAACFVGAVAARRRRLGALSRTDARIIRECTKTDETHTRRSRPNRRVCPNALNGHDEAAHAQPKSIGSAAIE